MRRQRLCLPDTVFPGTYERFVGVLARFVRRAGPAGMEASGDARAARGMPQKILVESYPHSTRKSLGIRPLPAKRKCRVSHLAEAYAALTALLPITTSQPPNHGQLQAIVGGLPGLAIEQRSGLGTRIIAQPPRWEGGHWREGFIVVPVARPHSAEETRRIGWPEILLLRWVTTRVGDLVNNSCSL